MPLPLLLGPAAGPAAAAAAKTALAFGAEVLPTVSSASLAAVLARLAWKRVPEWIRKDISFSSPSGEKDSQEMENLASVIEKLQGLLNTGSSKLDEPVPNLPAAILAFVQLSAQLKLTAPQDRDDIYHISGRPVNDNDDIDFQILKEALDLATLAYYVEDGPAKFLNEGLEEAGYELEQQGVATRPGFASHFVAISKERNTIVIGVRGTSTLEDLLTDCCGQAVPHCIAHEQDHSMERVEVRAREDDQVHHIEHSDEVEIVSGHERISMHIGYDEDLDVRCHEGILISARRLANHVEESVQDYCIEQGYKLLLVGHSLGAGVAGMLAIVLGSRLPKLSQDMMQVYAFAPPPVLDHDAALALSPYCTSIVNNSDLIPRWSLANLSVFLEFLRVVSNKLDEQGLRPTGPRTTAAFLRKLSKGSKGDLLMSSSEVRKAMDAAHDMIELKHPDHLYVPGRVLLMYEEWNETPVEETETTVADLKHYCKVSDGTMAVLRCIEIDGYRMLSDHITASYHTSIESLMDKRKQEEAPTSKDDCQ